jgi:hypothetical protein
VSLWRIKKLHTSDIQGHKHYHSSRRELWHRRNGIKARLKSSRANYVIPLELSSIQSMQCYDEYSKGLGKPCAYDLASWSLHSLFLGLVPLITYAFPWQIFHIPVISTFLEFPFHLQFHSHTFTYHPLRAACRNSDSATRCLPSKVSFWKLGGSLRDFCRPAKLIPYLQC